MESNIIFILIIAVLLISNGFILYLFMSRTNQINRFEQEKQDIKNQNDTLAKEIDKTQKELKELREESLEIKNKYKQTKAELFDVQTKNKELSEKCEISEKKLAESEETIRRLNIELEDIKSKETKPTDKTGVESAAARDNQENQQKIIRELNNKIKELEKKVTIYENEHKLEEYKNNIQLYQNRIKILEDQLLKIKTIAEEKSREVLSLRTKNENLDKAYMTIRGELAAALDKIAALKGEEGKNFHDETENKG